MDQDVSAPRALGKGALRGITWRMVDGYLRRVFVVMGFIALVAAATAGVWRYGYVQALDQLARQGRSDLALASDRLTGQLQRYRELAVLVADHPQVGAVLTGEDVAAAEALLLEIADKTAAEDIRLTDATGFVLARAHPELAEFDMAPLVRRAAQGALGWGNGTTTDGGRVFAYAAPVFDGQSQVKGAVVVTADLATIELDWVGSNPAVFFTNAGEQVFITNRSETVLWTRPEDAPGLKPADGPALPFDSYRVGRHEVWQMGWGPYLPKKALHLVRLLPVIGMKGEALVDVAPARRLATLQAAALAALCLAFGAMLFLATERRRTLAQANAQLEARVAERTAALLDTNTQLRREAIEREEAQTALKRAQEDLMRAGKLSALGQMSAGLSHELNQPLMAIQTFAENAVAFLERDTPARASDNLSRISDMARRMGRIIKNLRAFSRQESEPAVRVDLIEVLNSAVELTLPHLRHGGITLDFTPPDAPVWVSGGEVRLGQVFVNLISNAVDAMAGQDTRVLRIDIAGETVTVADTGPGIAMPAQMFDPFYSTKEVGASEGMGLGLSISYSIIQSFGGKISGHNGPEGAEFVVELNGWADEAAA
ncbi:MAG: ATP-binding protein [Tateyamaria sp.]